MARTSMSKARARRASASPDATVAENAQRLASASSGAVGGGGSSCDQAASQRPRRRLASSRPKPRFRVSRAPSYILRDPRLVPVGIREAGAGGQGGAIDAVRPRAGDLHEAEPAGGGPHGGGEGHADEDVHLGKPLHDVLLVRPHEIARYGEARAHRLDEARREAAHEGDCGAASGRVSREHHLGLDGQERRRPPSSVTRVCQTWVRLPRWSGVDSACAAPERPAAKKFVLTRAWWWWHPRAG